MSTVTSICFPLSLSLLFCSRVCAVIIHFLHWLSYESTHSTLSHPAWCRDFYGKAVTKFWSVPLAKNVVDIFQFNSDMIYLHDLTLLTPPSLKIHHLLTSLTLPLNGLSQNFSLVLLSLFRERPSPIHLLSDNDSPLCPCTWLTFLNHKVLCSATFWVFGENHKWNMDKASLSVFHGTNAHGFSSLPFSTNYTILLLATQNRILRVTLNHPFPSSPYPNYL